MTPNVNSSTPNAGRWVVTYDGFLGPVVRDFATREQAERWIAQVGIRNRWGVTVEQAKAAPK